MDTLTEVQFWNACSILIHNYHAVNRKIFACIIQHVEKILKNIHQYNQDCSWETVNEICNDDVQQLLSGYSNNKLKDDGTEGFVIHLKLLHKKQEASINAIVIISKFYEIISKKTLDSFYQEEATRDLRWLQHLLCIHF